MFTSILATIYGFRLNGGRRAGTVTIEYALLVALLVVVGIAAWASFGQTLRDALTEVVNAFNEAGV